MRIRREDFHTIFGFDIDNREDAESVFDFGRAMQIPSILDDTYPTFNELKLYYFLSEKLRLYKEEVDKKTEKLGLDNLFSDNRFDRFAGEVHNYVYLLSEQIQEELFEGGKQIFFNIINSGVHTLNEWYQKYWGCKENVRNLKILENKIHENEVVICFETLGIPPIEWCQAVSKMGKPFCFDWEGGGFQGLICYINNDEFEQFYTHESPVREDTKKISRFF